MNDKQKCECGKVATWIYAPKTDDGINPYYCEDCVPRGCMCNDYDIEDGWEPSPSEENITWEWKEKGKIWSPIDGNGLQYPCCEFLNEEDGFKIVENIKERD